MQIFKHNVKQSWAYVFNIVILSFLLFIKINFQFDSLLLLIYFIAILVNLEYLFYLLYYPFATIENDTIVLYKRFFQIKTLKLTEIKYVEIEGKEIFVKSEFGKITINLKTLNPEERKRFKDYFRSQESFETKTFEELE